MEKANAALESYLIRTPQKSRSMMSSLKQPV
jgi:hypothetical protein